MTNDSLTSKLQSESANRPEFSALLHERIMTGVRAAVAPANQPAPHYFRRGLIAVAATLLFAATAYIALRQSPPQGPAPHPIAIETPAIKPLDDMLALDTAAETLHEARFAYIDHDAKRFMFFLADQLPTSPPADKKAPR